MNSETPSIHRKGRLKRLLIQSLPPIVMFAAVIFLWWGATRIFDIPRLLLPGPERVAQAAISQAGPLTNALIRTGIAALLSCVCSLVLGTLIGFVFSQSKWIRSAAYPYAIFLQTVPIIAIAPLIVTWFGRGIESVILVGTIVSIFPIITNATAGLTMIDPDLRDLFRLYRASRWQTLRKLRLPSAVPSLVTGAKISSGVAVIGAIVGEFFTGGGPGGGGLGYLIRAKAEGAKTDELFATVFASTFLGVVIFGVVTLCGATILARWYDRGE